MKHSNFGVVLGAIKLFLHFTEGIPAIQQDVYERIHSMIPTHVHSILFHLLTPHHLPFFLLLLLFLLPHLSSLSPSSSSLPAPLLTFLGSTSSELVYTCLQHVQLLLARQPELWSKDYQIFFCRSIIKTNFTGFKFDLSTLNYVMAHVCSDQSIANSFIMMSWEVILYDDVMGGHSL